MAQRKPTPITQRRARERDQPNVIWGWHRELLALAMPVAAFAYLDQPLPALAAAIIVVAAIIGLIAWEPTRRRISYALHVGMVRRGWDRLMLGWKIIDVKQIAAGDQLHVRARRRQPAAKLYDRRGELATQLRVREVRVARDPDHDDAAHAIVTLVRSDPFADYMLDAKGKPTLRPLAWPDRDAEVLSGWDPITLGVDENGQDIKVNLFEHNFLIGGIPGSGKSVALSLFAAHGAKSPDVRLWMLDGKLIEFKAWKPVAHRLVGPDRKKAIKVLRELQTELDRRLTILGTAGADGRPLRKLTPEVGLPFEVLMVDELATYLHADDKQGKTDAAAILELLCDLCRRGRALGIVLVLATQKPDANTVNTALRDLIDTRLAFRCLTPQASDTILGQGWASNANPKADASEIPGAQRGVGLLYAEGDWPTRVRGYHLTDEDLGEIAGNIIGDQIAAEWATIDAPEPANG